MAVRKPDPAQSMRALQRGGVGYRVRAPTGARGWRGWEFASGRRGAVKVRIWASFGFRLSAGADACSWYECTGPALGAAYSGRTLRRNEGAKGWPSGAQ